MRDTYKSVKMQEPTSLEHPGMKTMMLAGEGVNEDGNAVGFLTYLIALADGNIAEIWYVVEPKFSNNCPLLANPDQADGDGDGIGDACDACFSAHAPSTGQSLTASVVNGAANGNCTLTPVF